MKTNQILAVCVLAAAGCTSSTDSSNAVDASGAEPNRPPLAANPESWPAHITNQFGMTFRLVTVDPSRPEHKDSFPKSSYYLQETELTGEQHDAFRKAADGRGIFESIAPGYRGTFPSEWREALRYAVALSMLDAEFDYRLPSRSQWTFACMSGYEQRCDTKEPNAFGFTGMLSTSRGDAEAIDEVFVQDGHTFGVLMGYWKNNWHEHDGETKPECPCEYWTACNRDADDSLNELITARFVLIPKEVREAAGESSGLHLSSFNSHAIHAAIPGKCAQQEGRTGL